MSEPGQSSGAVPTGATSHTVSSETRSLPVPRLLLAWFVGLIGPIAAVRGWGRVFMDPPVQLRGGLILAAVTLSWVVIARLAVDRVPAVQLLAQAGAYATCVPASASSAGRGPRSWR